MTLRKPKLGSLVCQTLESVDTSLERGSRVSLFDGATDGGHVQRIDNEMEARRSKCDASQLFI